MAVESSSPERGVTAPPRTPPRTRGALSAAGLVVASMIGTGVYTTSGLLLEHLSAAAVVVVWLVGGLCAMAGALAYAELGVRYPHQGPASSIRAVPRWSC